MQFEIYHIDGYPANETVGNRVGLCEIDLDAERLLVARVGESNAVMRLLRPRVETINASGITITGFERISENRYMFRKLWLKEAK